MTPNPSLTSFNNSVVVGSYRYDATKMSDTNALFSIYNKEQFTTYKGMLALWNQRRLMSTPLLNMTELSNSVVYVNGAEGKVRYSVPFEIGLPVIIENVATHLEKPGIDGQKFPIKLSENCYTNTDIITYDYRDGDSLYVTEDEIYQDGNGWIYTVQIPQSQANKGAYFSHKYLTPGTPFMKITNVNGEYDTQKSTVSQGQGIMDLELQMGGHRSVFHWITGYADMLELDKNDPRYAQLSYLNQFGNMKNPNSTLVFFNKDREGKVIPTSMSWMKRIEAQLWAEMKMMEERDLMWSQGGIVQGSGRSQVRVNVGLYPQMRNGNRILYDELDLSIIENAVADLYFESGIPIEQRRTVIDTGTAGLIEISKLLAEDFKTQIPFLTNTGDIPGLITGSAMNLGYGLRFTTKRFPVAGTVEFRHNAALDNVTGVRASDRMIGEYPIESHTFMIMDVTDGNITNAASKLNTDNQVADGFNDSSNIVLLKPKGYDQIEWGYQLGTKDPYGRAAGMASTSQRHGYAIWMQSFSSIWLKDATRTVLIEKRRTK